MEDVGAILYVYDIAYFCKLIYKDFIRYYISTF